MSLTRVLKKSPMALGMALKLVWPPDAALRAVQFFLWLFQSASWHSREQYCMFWHFAQRLRGIESSDWGFLQLAQAFSRPSIPSPAFGELD